MFIYLFHSLHVLRILINQSINQSQTLGYPFKFKFQLHQIKS